MPPKTTPAHIRFWRMAKKTETCWLWTGARQGRGYGFFMPDSTLEGRKSGGMMAHRFSYFLANGELPEGKMVCHTCDNRACVNPGHLFIGDAATNMQDCISKGRTKYMNGSELPQAKLNEDKVRKIKKMLREGIGQRLIGLKFGVGRGAIQDIKRRKNWGWVK